MSKRKLVGVMTCSETIKAGSPRKGKRCGRLLPPGEQFCGFHSEERKAKVSAVHKGKKASRETKDKMSVAATGKKLSEETKARISKTKTGVKLGPLSEEHKAKIGDGNRGQIRGPLSEEHKAKMSLANSGPNHGNWKGGHRPGGYCAEFTDDPDKHWIYERDGHTCQMCGCEVDGERGLTQHHRHHIRGDKSLNAPWDLITLCMHCNWHVLPYLPADDQLIWQARFMQYTRAMH